MNPAQRAKKLREAGLYVMAAVSPLLPIDDPDGFFKELSGVVDSVVIDHYVGGDGSAGGHRTARTRLPAAMAEVNSFSVDLAYRDQMVKVAQVYFPSRVGVGYDGFARRFLP